MTALHVYWRLLSVGGKTPNRLCLEQVLSSVMCCFFCLDPSNSNCQLPRCMSVAGCLIGILKIFSATPHIVMPSHLPSEQVCLNVYRRQGCVFNTWRFHVDTVLPCDLI